ncbi:LAQU0S08e01904g1_1 [Lachancea quebecensis]|uniref:LAQU0S08e01904g1_1 n=1 Tax=Lachancea quebecensis TaxID=1654605 RepID=A0A0P1KTE5_9SACH|nr:LAQU0S08e01904g1_1 [Lachancea quebecensis]
MIRRYITTLAEEIDDRSINNSMSGVNKKRDKKKVLKNLKGALKGLLAAENASTSVQPSAKATSSTTQSTNEELKQATPPRALLSHAKPRETAQPLKIGNSESSSLDKIVYIMSKESHLIPKLTDEQVMSRHKQADENMKRVWAHLIEKYGSLEDQGDVLNLATGEIIEDNGHVRGLSAQVADNNERYVSVLSDLLDIDTTTDNVWDMSSETEDEGTEEAGGLSPSPDT